MLTKVKLYGDLNQYECWSNLLLELNSGRAPRADTSCVISTRGPLYCGISVGVGVDSGVGSVVGVGSFSGVKVGPGVISIAVGSIVGTGVSNGFETQLESARPAITATFFNPLDLNLSIRKCIIQYYRINLKSGVAKILFELFFVAQ
mgnify:CR=1 FL=1